MKIKPAKVSRDKYIEMDNESDLWYWNIIFSDGTILLALENDTGKECWKTRKLPEH